MEQIFEQLCGLNEEGGCSIIVDYKLYCLKDKSVYHNLSLLMPYGSVFKGLAWMRVADEEKVEE